MDSISDPDTDEIVVMSSAQVGKSELINNIIGYYIDYDPSPMLLMQPTLEMAEAYSKDRIAPMIRDTPTLTKKVNSPKAKDGNNTLLQKKFAGGHLTLVGANSPAEPNSSGYILEQFLEGELEQGLTLISRFTTNLTNETNNIMDQVNDIIGLPHLEDSGVQEGVIYSKRKRDDTVTQLHEFDATQTNALYPVEQDIQTMKTWLADLEG